MSLQPVVPVPVGMCTWLPWALLSGMPKPPAVSPETNSLTRPEAMAWMGVPEQQLQSMPS